MSGVASVIGRNNMKKFRIKLWQVLAGILLLLVLYILHIKSPIQLIQVHQTTPDALPIYHQPKGRLMYMAASYDLSQYQCLWNSLTSLVETCNAGWNISVHLQVSNGLAYDSVLYQQIQDSMYCAYFDRLIPVLLTSYNASIGFGLNSRHRQLIHKHLNDFDYFVYAEEDMVFKHSHLIAYLHAYEQVRVAYPLTYHTYTIGFLRYLYIMNYSIHYLHRLFGVGMKKVA